MYFYSFDLLNHVQLLLVSIIQIINFLLYLYKLMVSLDEFYNIMYLLLKVNHQIDPSLLYPFIKINFNIKNKKIGKII